MLVGWTQKTYLWAVAIVCTTWLLLLLLLLILLLLLLGLLESLLIIVDLVIFRGSNGVPLSLLLRGIAFEAWGNTDLMMLQIFKDSSNWSILCARGLSLSELGRSYRSGYFCYSILLHLWQIC